VFFIVDEDAREGEREKVGPQEAAAVHGVAPSLADASDGGEPARRDAAEDLGEHVVRQTFQLILVIRVVPGHRDDVVANWRSAI
jgi:hypothetical protein